MLNSEPFRGWESHSTLTTSLSCHPVGTRYSPECAAIAFLQVSIAHCVNLACKSSNKRSRRKRSVLARLWPSAGRWE